MSLGDVPKESSQTTNLSIVAILALKFLPGVPLTNHNHFKFSERRGRLLQLGHYLVYWMLASEARQGSTPFL